MGSRVYARGVWWLVAAALADAGSKRCTMQGKDLEIRWTESGVVKVLHNGDVVVSTNIGARKGPTSATCKATAVKFLTDTKEAYGKITLDTVNMELKSVLETLGENDPAPAPAPRPKPRPRPKVVTAPKPVVVPPTPGERQARECAETHAFAAYGDAWTVRSVTVEPIEPGARRILALQLFEDQEVRAIACSEEAVTSVRLTLVDAEGRRKADGSGGPRQPEVQYTPETDATYHLLVENPSNAAGAIAVAILTR